MGSDASIVLFCSRWQCPKRSVFEYVTQKKFIRRTAAFVRDATIYNKTTHINLITYIMDITITVMAFVVFGLIILLFVALRSRDDVNLKVNLRKGEMNLKKRKRL